MVTIAIKNVAIAKTLIVEVIAMTMLVTLLVMKVAQLE